MIAAIGSRSLDRSEMFAGRHGIPAACGSYEELVAADVDVIYVATPHSFHYEAALMALDAGKHVLVEKPIGDWAWGPIRSRSSRPSSASRTASWHSLGEPHESGVNGQLSAVMSFAGGRQAMMNTQLHNFTLTSATIVGTEASLTIDGPFNMPGNFSVRFPEGTRLAYEERAGAHFEGLHDEAAAVARAISAGQLEVPQRPLAESIRTMAVADAIRNQIGIVFPGEPTRDP